MTALSFSDPLPRQPEPDARPSDGEASLSDEETEKIWRELALGYWQVVSAVDVDGTRRVTIAPTPSRPEVDWARLTGRERQVLGMVARGLPQKVIAPRIGLSASAVSAAVCSARDRLGFASSSELVRACQGAGKLLRNADAMHRSLDGGAAVLDVVDARRLGDPPGLLGRDPLLQPERAGADGDSLASDRGSVGARTKDVDQVDLLTDVGE